MIYPFMTVYVMTVWPTAPPIRKS